MWKTTFVCAWLHCTIVSAAAPAIGRTARAFPDTSERIIAYADQFPSQLSPAQWKFVATHFAGGQKQTREWVRTIRKLNPDFLMLHYQLAVGAGPAKFVVGDDWVSDFDEVHKHDHWFVHDDGWHRLRQKRWDWYVMDIRFAGARPISGFPHYWLDAALARMRANEDDGTFADSYTQDVLMRQVEPAGFGWFSNASACKSKWLPHLNAYGAFVANGFAAAPEKFYFLPNLGGLVTTWDDVTKLDVGDGGMVEGFAAPGAGQFYSTDDWQLQMTRILSLAAKEKIILCQSSIDAADADGRWFIVCAHLLTKGRYSYLNMFEKSSLEWYPEYELSLGAPLGELQTDVAKYWDPPTKTFRRSFAKGEVLVNPGSNSSTVEFPHDVQMLTATGGGAIDADGKSKGQLTEQKTRSVHIPAHSGRVVMFER